MKPQFLYRYFSFIPERVKPVFEKNTIFFPCAKDFNDPFDSQLKYSTDSTREEKFEFIVRTAQRVYPNLGRQQCEEATRKLFEMRSEADFQRAVDEMIEKDAASHFGILSFSEKRDDLLMWAHYADKHQGFCLEFKTDNEFFREVTKVEYVIEYPNVNFLRRQRGDEMRFHSTKGKHWEYEQEWRVFNVVQGRGAYPFPPESLTGVIFGLQMPEENERVIRDWVKIGKSTPRFYKAQKKIREFGLEVMPDAKD